MGGCFSKKVIIGCDHNSYSNEIDEDNSIFKAFAEAVDNKGFVDEDGFNFPLPARPEPVSELQISSDDETSIEAKEDREFIDECGFNFLLPAHPEPVSELQISSDEETSESEDNEGQFVESSNPIISIDYNNPVFKAFASPQAQESSLNEVSSSSNTSEDLNGSDDPICRHSMAQKFSLSNESNLSGDISESIPE